MLFCAVGTLPLCASAATQASLPEATIIIDVNDKKAEIAPTMYGIFFEDINRSADGGLYGEMLFNRGFEEKNLPSGCTYNPDDKRVYAPYKQVYSDQKQLRSWSIPWDIEDTHPGWDIEAPAQAVYSMRVGDTEPLNIEGSKSLYVTIDKFAEPFRLTNTGYYGLAVRKGAKYDLVFYLRADETYKGSVTAEMLTEDNRVVGLKKFRVKNDGAFHKYTAVLNASETMNNGKFALRFSSPGKIAVDYVSLFPQETFMNRSNGFRKDVAEFVADLNPAFMRWPGGCIVEGLTMENRVKWKNTIGPVEKRKGEYNLWGYYSTNGFGYHEFLQYCEDVGMQAMFVCNAGMSCDGRNGDYYEEDQVEELIMEALDAIEYAIGPKESKWGAERARNGHPEPFSLDYIEVGNENHSPMYAQYYNMFYDRIREAYPDITIITCLPMDRQLDNLKGFDMNDPHFYNFPTWYYQNTNYFDQFERGDYKVYVGEYACNMGVGSGNMEGALSEAAFIMGMERNSDLVTMTSYAPLMENTKCRMGVNLILVQNDDVIGRSSYYVTKLYADHRPDVNLATAVELGKLPDKTSPFGGIGLGTYETGAEYSNIKITVDEEKVYDSNRDGMDKWKPVSGKWEIADGKIIQTREGTDMTLFEGFDTSSRNYSVEFDAVKTGGKEGFVLLFGANGASNGYQMTLGSFGNAWTIFQRVRDGNAFVLNTDRPVFRIRTGQKYNVKLVVKGDILECWIDGELNLRYDNTYIQRQYAIAGLDKAKNEVVVKVINAEEVPMRSSLKFSNASFEPNGTSVTLAADSRFVENTFEDRYRIYPEEKTLTDVSNDMTYIFKPMSMTILRLKLK